MTAPSAQFGAEPIVGLKVAVDAVRSLSTWSGFSDWSPAPGPPSAQLGPEPIVGLMIADEGPVWSVRTSRGLLLIRSTSMVVCSVFASLLVGSVLSSEPRVAGARMVDVACLGSYTSTSDWAGISDSPVEDWLRLKGSTNIALGGGGVTVSPSTSGGAGATFALPDSNEKIPAPPDDTPFSSSSSLSSNAFSCGTLSLVGTILLRLPGESIVHTTPDAAPPSLSFSSPADNFFGGCGSVEETTPVLLRRPGDSTVHTTPDASSSSLSPPPPSVWAAGDVRCCLRRSESGTTALVAESAAAPVAVPVVVAKVFSKSPPDVALVAVAAMSRRRFRVRRPMKTISAAKAMTSTPPIAPAMGTIETPPPPPAAPGGGVGPGASPLSTEPEMIGNCPTLKGTCAIKPLISVAASTTGVPAPSLISISVRTEPDLIER
mmetsp:Transcript_7680/g.12897  ORF Transcript_7680/g.12897 Transcript_7680/m.12897 type:complete len:432 (-) Transcript_7680:576-1871(-)